MNSSFENLRVAVIGLSSNQIYSGIGKSCLIERFINNAEDLFSPNHSSLISSSDFSSATICNKHYLYWGIKTFSVSKETSVAFHIIEHTQFLDDMTFKPFQYDKSYIERCLSLKLYSSGKKQYLGRDKLGLEPDDALEMPNEFSLDAFMYVYDVSRDQESKRDEQFNNAKEHLKNILSTNKPVVLVTTKNDCQSNLVMHDIQCLTTSKLFKNYSIPVIHTSAFLNVNIQHAFQILWKRCKSKKTSFIQVSSYEEALKKRQEYINQICLSFKNMLTKYVTSHQNVWADIEKEICERPTYKMIIHECGKTKTKEIFQNVQSKLDANFFEERLKIYSSLFIDRLKYCIGDDLVFSNWQTIRQKLLCKPEYSFHFSSDGHYISKDSEYDLSLMKIPTEFLYSSQAEIAYNKFIEEKNKENDLKRSYKEFKNIFCENPNLCKPGITLHEVSIYIKSRESFQKLDDVVKEKLYLECQTVTLKKLLRNLVDLACECARKTMKVNEFCEMISYDPRYSDLAAINEKRQQLVDYFIDSGKLCVRLPFDQCVFPDFCSIKTKNLAPVPELFMNSFSKFTLEKTNKLVKVLVITTQHDLLIYLPKIYNGKELEYLNNFNTVERFHAVILHFNDSVSLKYVKTIVSHLFNTELGLFKACPCTIFTDDKLNLYQEANEIASQLQCMSVNNIEEVGQSVLMSIEARRTFVFPFHMAPSFEPDITLVIAHDCGSELSLKNIINPFLQHQSLFSSSTDHNLSTLRLQCLISKNKLISVEVVLGALHNFAPLTKEEHFDGIILSINAHHIYPITFLNEILERKLLQKRDSSIILIVNSLHKSCQYCSKLQVSYKLLASRINAHLIFCKDEYDFQSILYYNDIIKSIYEKKNGNLQSTLCISDNALNDNINFENNEEQHLYADLDNFAPPDEQIKKLSLMTELSDAVQRFKNNPKFN